MHTHKRSEEHREPRITVARFSLKDGLSRRLVSRFCRSLWKAFWGKVSFFTEIFRRFEGEDEVLLFHVAFWKGVVFALTSGGGIVQSAASVSIGIEFQM